MVFDNKVNISNVVQNDNNVVKKGNWIDMFNKEKNSNHKKNDDYTHILSKKNIEGRKLKTRNYKSFIVEVITTCPNETSKLAFKKL